MSKNFNVPKFFKSPNLVELKRKRKEEDPKRKDLSPTEIRHDNVNFKLARHFGFCYGVENAIDIAYRAIEENPNKRIFLLSEMIHNPEVNADLISKGVRFLMQTDGKRLIDFKTLTPEDIVIVPAFGTTVELQKELEQIGIDPYKFDTTCPFVQKVWKRSTELGKAGYTVIVHGKKTHEETRATFSHSNKHSPTIVILNMKEADLLISYIKGEMTEDKFYETFGTCISEGFNPKEHLKKVGVVNQTTMLATETQDIALKIKQAMLDKHGSENINQHFADTKDTLCYATYENQTATLSLIENGADLAIIVGGYNSSNTSHLVELAEQRMPTFYIKNSDEIIDQDTIQHFDLHQSKLITSKNWLPTKRPLEIAVTSGASCPDTIVENVINKIIDFVE